MTAIKLNLINQSNDHNNSQIVIFQKNAVTSVEELAVAWQVISNLGQGWQHPFTYSMNVSVGAGDAWGNYSPQQPAQDGQQFSVVRDTSGDVLTATGTASNPNEIEILNALAQGTINANVYRDGKLTATKTSVAPGQKAVFEFKPTIWVGVVSQVEEGEVMNSAIISQVNTEISLFGLASADIVMTGGGSGPDAKPFEFTLQNIKYA
ncbi:hypothetical protein F0L74_21845 [Chitinophaga agrisoli]|uniref:Aromatic ring-opening dioxygenase LigA n=1 Tax=Chitinophaga agrisoli TaxID=2607653 RepID=A0A5B2VJV1_9BACT|nr:hypothetical protein [Chitinophaga agrisoli]KAA2238860.1 hypothetical protein F0L74_21845 [Chitinophaga agrisoli]